MGEKSEKGFLSIWHSWLSVSINHVQERERVEK